MRKLLPYLFSFIAVAALAAYIVYEGYRDLRRVAPPAPVQETVVEEDVPEVERVTVPDEGEKSVVDYL